MFCLARESFDSAAGWRYKYIQIERNESPVAGPQQWTYKTERGRGMPSPSRSTMVREPTHQSVSLYATFTDELPLLATNDVFRDAALCEKRRQNEPAMIRSWEAALCSQALRACV